MDIQEFSFQLLAEDGLPEPVRQAFSGNDHVCMAVGRQLYVQNGTRCYTGPDHPLIRDFLRGYRFLDAKVPVTAKESMLRRLLTDPFFAADHAEELKKMFAHPEAIRTVILIRPGEPGAQHEADDAVLAQLPIEKQDYILKLTGREIAIVKTITDLLPDETSDYARAIIETLENETGIRCIAGIGNYRTDLSLLCRSYGEAGEAIETALLFGKEPSVFSFREMTVERILKELPAERRAEFAKELTLRNPAMMTEVTMETIRTFLESDLSLTETSKKLFIHRNTLIYRLDKIRDDTGLDIRNFHDALILRILLLLNEMNLVRNETTKEQPE